ncbi:MAG TPA: serine/threonine-protein kinase [Sandaracinaceae bacterium]
MFRAGDRIDRYEIMGELGRGGMATLYLAREHGGREVAIKVMHREVANDVEVQKMFLDEARLSTRIRHPNVVRVERIASCERGPYIVMEYVRGATLAAVLRARAAARAPLPVELAVAIAAKIAEALHAAHETRDELGHELGIVHRDVSPSNVLLGVRGDVKLIDFGVARARKRLARTMPGCVKGKLAYMAPEQLAGVNVDRRADVFALGVVLWEMLALRRLFHAADDLETILRIRDPAPVPPPSLHRADVPAQLDDVVATMLARHLEERFSTAAAARHAMLLACPDALSVGPERLAALVAAQPAAAPSIADEPTVPARPEGER